MKLHLSSATLIYFSLSLFLIHDWTIAAILSAIFIHEMAHLIVLWALGGKATSLTITPLGLSIDRAGLLSHSGEIVLSLAAPILNIVLAAIYAHYDLNSCTTEANLSFGLINLIPIYPLDGGKAFAAFLHSITSAEKAARISDVLSHICLIIVWMLGIATALILKGGLSLLLLSIGLFITIAPMSNTNK